MNTTFTKSTETLIVIVLMPVCEKKNLVGTLMKTVTISPISVLPRILLKTY
jgi:hypothetical protein